MKKILYYLLLLCFLPAGCQNKNTMEEKYQEAFDWDINPSGPIGYPMEIVYGEILDAENGGNPIPAGHFLDNGWGAANIIYAVNRKAMVPERMHLTFFSYTENKFYRGEFMLPQDTLYTLLKGPFLKGKNKVYFTSFVVSVAPEGRVGLWLSGGAGTVFIDSWKASETFMNWADFYPNNQIDSRETIIKGAQSEMYSFVQKEIKESTLSGQYWKDLTVTYPWKLELKENEDNPLRMFNFKDKTVNSETISCFLYPDYLNTDKPKTIPRSLGLYYIGNFNIRYAVRIYLAERWGNGKPVAEQIEAEMKRLKELKRIFDAFYEKSGKKAFTLQLEFDEHMKEGKLYLKNDTEQQELEGVKIEIINSLDYPGIEKPK